MPMFGDVGKTIKDLLSGFSYDQKLAVSTVAVPGVGKVNVTGVKSQKDKAYSGDIKATKSIMGSSLELTVNDKKKISVALTSTPADVPGLKTTLEGVLLDAKSIKVALQYTKIANTGLKLTSTVSGTPKIDVSAGYAPAKGILVGGELTFDASKADQLAKYSLGAQYTDAAAGTVSAILGDKLGSLKLGYVYALDKATSIGAEADVKLKTMTPALQLGVSHKLAGNASLKVNMTDKMVCSFLYSDEVQKGTKVTAAFQTAMADQSKGLFSTAKVGVQVTTAI